MRNRFHSICPYFAMFPEQFVEEWVNRLTKPRDVVLDPFCGRGTTAFQSLLMNRRAVACDVNDVAYCVTRAKTSAPRLASVLQRLTELKKHYIDREWKRNARRLPEFFRVCFHTDTLAAILYLRSELQWKKSRRDCMIAALALGTLHGECN